MRKILITNDDGIEEDGLIRLAVTAKEFGEVWVVAPETQRSAASQSITLRHSIEAWEHDFPVEGVHAYACNGTPADCVRIGVLSIVPGKPDKVFTGINLGYNTASDLQYSATAGAAFEASFQEVDAIAFSEGFDKEHEVTRRYLKEIMAELIDRSLPKNSIWNVNFPGCSLEEFKGILRDAKVSQDAFFQDRYIMTKIGEGRYSFMVDGILKHTAEDGTDLRAIYDNQISIGVAKNIS